MNEQIRMNGDAIINELPRMNVANLIQDIAFATQMLDINRMRAVDSSTTKDVHHSDRQVVLDSARKLVSALESPEETVCKISKEPAGHAAFRSALRMKIFESVGVTSSISARELAVKTGSEQLLVVRIMRVLLSIGFFSEDGEEKYSHNSLSRTLCNATFRTMIIGMCETTTVLSKLPEFLVSINFRNPVDSQNSLFHYAHQTHLGLYEWLQTQPEQVTIFNAYMSATTKIQENSLRDMISSLFTADKEVGVLGHNKSWRPNEEEVILVDVGGGHGHVLEDFCKQRPDIKGRVIVQDLPGVIEGRAPVNGVEVMAYNMFTTQPVRGAQIYYFRHIFHNWSDTDCRRILTNTIPALTPNYSSIVIVDMVVPNTGCPSSSALMDISMIPFGGMERSVRQWHELLGSLGLIITRIENPKPGSLNHDGLIEAVLKTDCLKL